MSVPKPPSSLDGSCSVIYGGTLYSYTPEAFLALPLIQEAEWKELEMGEKVTGAKCVGSTAGDPGFFVVGGTGGSDGYTGLQKFSYSTGNWTTITPSSLVTKERQWHGVTYLEAINTIVVYAGSQDGSKAPSSQTFTIQASEPYAAQAYEATGNRPAIDPILLPWSNADVCFIGGDAGNTAVYLFNPSARWRDSGASLSQALTKDTSSIQAVIKDGDDGSKSLYTFDLSVTSDQVKRFVLQDASGKPIANSPPVAKAKRDLTLSDWPEYNSTLAPDYTRQNYAISQGADGNVVFSGGNDQKPIDLFNTDDNAWLNSTQFFSNPEQKLLDETTTSSSTFSTTTTFSSSTTSSTEISTTSTEPTSTATTTSTLSISETSATASATEAAAVATGDKHDSAGLSSNVILGITLGSILAFLALLGLILFCLRRRRARKHHTETGHARRDSGPNTNEKTAVAFSNSTQPPPSPGIYRGHQHQASNESYSSMAILMGRVGQQKPTLTRKPSNDTNRSSVSSLHKQHFKSTISKPVLQVTEPEFLSSNSQHPALQGQDDKGVAFDPTVAEPRPRNGPLQTEDGMRRSSGWNRYWSGGSALQILGFGGSRRNTSASDQSSRYSSEATSYNNPRVTQDSATVPPLNFQGHPEVNSVNSGSPVVATYGSTIPFKDGMTGKIERPPSNASSGYSSGIPESVHEAWDRDESKPWGADRAVQWNSAYNPNFYFGTPLSPSQSGTRKPPSGVSQQPQLAMAATSSDMSWLNLGDQSRK